MSRGEVSVVVPTLGKSPWLEACLAALRQDGGGSTEIILVDQSGCDAARAAEAVADRRLALPKNLGFAGGTNAGIATSRAPLVATVNDDLVVAPGWIDRLVAALDAEPEVAAVQGTNLRLHAEDRIDGCGLAWNRFWQAVQVGRDLSPPRDGTGSVERFGVSATAALYRREALERTTLAPAGVARGPFDDRLESYYEDVDLACRLRAHGYHALHVRGASARHAGSTTADAPGLGRRQRLIYGNRLLVLARLLGSGFWPRLPLVLARDMVDLLHLLTPRTKSLAAGLLSGWLRALKRLRGFARFGAPLVPITELERLAAERAPL